jgi:hypothetical protein
VKEATLSLTHPILFVMDFHNNEATIPGYSPESVVSANSSCISVKAIADVDGEVTALLADRMEGTALTGLRKVFEGKIMTPTRKVAIVTSDNESAIEIDVSGKITTVIVHVNDLEHPSRLLIETF